MWGFLSCIKCFRLSGIPEGKHHEQHGSSILEPFVLSCGIRPWWHLLWQCASHLCAENAPPPRLQPGSTPSPPSADGLFAIWVLKLCRPWDKATGWMASVICIYDITFASWNQVRGPNRVLLYSKLYLMLGVCEGSDVIFLSPCY